MRSSARESITLIDGRSGSGKSTLARQLADQTGSFLVSVDDVYPGWDGLDAGSAHIYRFVLQPRIAGGHASYRQWNWDNCAPGDWVDVPSRPLIIEGCGVLRSTCEDFSATRIWLELQEPLRRERALRRDGDMFAPHWERWALQETRFIASHAPESRATEIRYMG